MTQTTAGVPAQETPVPSLPANAGTPEEKASSMEAKALDFAVQADKLSGAIRPDVRPHAFVIMPFGKKKGSDGSIYDFNAIYSQLIKPSLEAAGFEAFRADEETASGDILTDMFQELLLADLCIADMSIDNANVFYERGIFVEAYFPISESAYVRDFVSPAGEGWVDRYYTMRNYLRVNEYF